MTPLTPTRRQLLALLGVGSVAAVAACVGGKGLTSTDGRIRLAMFQPPRSGLNPLSDDAFKLSRTTDRKSVV